MAKTNPKAAQASSKEPHIFKVIEGRVIFFTHKKKNTVWARGGQFIQPKHPVLLKMVETQISNLNKVDKLPEGAELHEKLPTDVQDMMRSYKSGPADFVASAKGKTASKPSPSANAAPKAPAID